MFQSHFALYNFETDYLYQARKYQHVSTLDKVQALSTFMHKHWAWKEKSYTSRKTCNLHSQLHYPWLEEGTRKLASSY